MNGPKSAAQMKISSLTGGKIVTVAIPASNRSYDIIVGDNLLREAGSLIKQPLGQRRCIILTDKNVAAIYQQRLVAVLSASGHEVLSTITITPGESSKDFNHLQKVLAEAFKYKIDRQTLIIALGGGVVGDLAGVTASLLLRGLDIVQIPTTLLAQVDSSVGGKTGVNSDYGKNTIGTFYQPRLVLADVSTLDSLPERELRAGYAEIIKYGLIRDAGFFSWCQMHGAKLLSGDRAAQIQAVSQSCDHKSQVVAADEREAGERALLNLGHTFGHALETVTGYSSVLLHGEAVAIGMAMAFRLSANLGFCSQADANAVQEHLQSVKLPVVPPTFDYDIDQLMNLMAQDKKAKNGKLTLILAHGIGQAYVANDVNPSPVRELWRSVIE